MLKGCECVTPSEGHIGNGRGRFIPGGEDGLLGLWKGKPRWCTGEGKLAQRPISGYLCYLWTEKVDLKLGMGYKHRKHLYFIGVFFTTMTYHNHRRADDSSPAPFNPSPCPLRPSTLTRLHLLSTPKQYCFPPVPLRSTNGVFFLRESPHNKTFRTERWRIAGVCLASACPPSSSWVPNRIPHIVFQFSRLRFFCGQCENRTRNIAHFNSNPTQNM